MTINYHHNIIEPGCSIYTKYNQPDAANALSKPVPIVGFV